MLFWPTKCDKLGLSLQLCDLGFLTRLDRDDGFGMRRRTGLASIEMDYNLQSVGSFSSIACRVTTTLNDT